MAKAIRLLVCSQSPNLENKCGFLNQETFCRQGNFFFFVTEYLYLEKSITFSCVRRLIFSSVSLPVAWLDWKMAGTLLPTPLDEDSNSFDLFGKTK